MAPHDARQVREMDRRNEAKIDLRIAEARALAGNEDVVRDGERHAAPARRAADSGNRRLAETVLHVE